MFIKNLQFAFRNFKKNRVITAINILGLAVGISASIVLFLMVDYDFSFDRWEPRKNDIYRVYTKVGSLGTNSGVSLAVPEAINQHITGIEAIAHFIQAPFDISVAIPNVLNGRPKVFIKNDDVSFADDNYFKIFPHQWLAGNRINALSGLNQVVFSESEAKKYFPDMALEKMIGQPVIFNDSINTTLTGIVADLKGQTDFDNKIFISLSTYMETNLKMSQGSGGWSSVNGSSQCFILLHQGADIANINVQLKKLYVENQKEDDEKYMQIGVLQPLSGIHFNTSIDGKVSKSSLMNLSVLALLLLLLAAINFINLSTAQSTLRAKEIGVRKTFGGNNRQIIYQFLTETFLVTACATLFAVILSPFLLYVFKGFIREGVGAKEIFQPIVIVFLIVMVIVITILAGLYPAFVLTKFRPALVLKNQTISKGKSRSVWVRQVLTVSQFVIAQVFLVVVFVIGKQIHFILNKDLGFRKDAVVSFYLPNFGSELDKKMVLYNELKKNPQIQTISLSNGTPTFSGWMSTRVTWYNKGKKNDFDNVHTRTADSNYLSVFKLQLLEGRNLHIDTSSRVADVLINETLLHQMGFHDIQNAIGQYISGGRTDSSQIVGVLKDFTTLSLHSPIQPTVVFADNTNTGNQISILLNANDPHSWKSTLDNTQKVFKSVYPDKEFDYKFFDDTIKNLYKNDSRLSSLLKWATGLAIFISCLGLLGLVSFMANQRTKEIGIRKVLGASVMQIITLLSKSLIMLVVLASIIAFPIGWYFSHKWLQDFAFKTTLSWWVFFISGIGMLLIALTVLCLRTFRAAKANPVDSLRDE
ncbi:MAG TPA: FtsX-like permease family protein [Arachidicoccus sp.]